MKGNLYNTVFGENRHANKLLKILGLTRADFGRYRDIYLTDKGGTITVYTRIGGKNDPYFSEHKRRLGMHPDIMLAWDDEFDDTYHYVKFRVPNYYLPRTTKMYAVQGEPKTVHDMFEGLNREALTLTPEEIMADPRFEPMRKLYAQAEAAPSGAVLGFFDDDTPEDLRI